MLKLNTAQNELLEYLKESPIRYSYAFARYDKFKLTPRQIKEVKEQYIQSLQSEVKETSTTMKVKRMWVSNNKTTIQYENSEETVTPEILFKEGWKFEPYESVKGKVALVYTSDKHIGAAVSDRALLGNHYDLKEFELRMQKTALELIKLHSLHNFSKVIICDLGDAIDGMDGFTGSRRHNLPQNMSNREVYQGFMDTHIAFFNTLHSHIDCDIEFRTAGESNHGGDMEWICFKSLGLFLNEKFKMTVNIGNKFIEHFTLGEHTFLLCHGKDFKDMKFPLPKNINDKTLIWIKAYIDHHKIDSKFVHFIKGDIHVSNSELTEFVRYKNVLSMFGASQWVQTNFMSNTSGTSIDILDLDSNLLMETSIFY